jgi:hypothetical protein
VFEVADVVSEGYAKLNPNSAIHQGMVGMQAREHPWASQRFQDLHKGVLDAGRKVHGETVIAMDLYAKPPDWMRSFLEKWISDVAREVQKQPLLLHELQMCAMLQLKIITKSEWYAEAYFAVKLFLGGGIKFPYAVNEEKVLYKPLGREIKTIFDVSVIRARVPVEIDLTLLDEGDEGYFPQLLTEGMAYDSSGVAEGLRMHSWPAGATINMVRETLVDAYYNQYYLPNPRGSYLRVSGECGIHFVTLKVKPSKTDPAYIDIIARVRTDGGSCIVLLHGDFTILDEGRLGTENKISFLWLVVAQLYHDLVTAKKIDGDEALDQGVGRKLREDVSKEGPWIQIPRITGRARPDESLRSRLAAPHVRKPFAVSGYPRKARMSELQRQNIQDFEVRTGLSVFRLLKEGETWVRPYTNPKGSEAKIKELPRFVRYHIEEALRQRFEEFRAKN